MVNGERVQMAPGDLVLTPNWSWHDHANDTDAPMIWLDGLDTPLVRMLEAGFYEEYHQDGQEVASPVNASEWHYPISEMRAALQRLAADSAGGTGKEIILEYTNRRTGGPVMPTIACHMQLLRPGERSKARRGVCRTNYHAVEGTGYSVVGDQRLDWEEKDVFTVPTWSFCEHVNSGEQPGIPVQLQRRAGHEGAEPLPRADEAVAAGGAPTGEADYQPRRCRLRPDPRDI